MQSENLWVVSTRHSVYIFNVLEYFSSRVSWNFIFKFLFGTSSSIDLDLRKGILVPEDSFF
jgi:hypothetical protein